MSDGVRVIRLALLGAWQVNRESGWRDAVKARADHVLPSRAYARARRILRRELSTGDTSCPVQIRLVGYSWGGWTAIHVVQRLVRRPHHIHRSLRQRDWTVRLGLLDPVRTFRRSARLPNDPRVKAWNVYQRNGCYQGCPGPSRWFRGCDVRHAAKRDVTDEGRGRSSQDGVPSACAPDHIQLGYLGWNGWDIRIARVLDGDEPF